VHIASSAVEFIAAAQTILKDNDHDAWLRKVDTFLKNISWYKTWQAMESLINQSIAAKDLIQSKKESYV
jgi:hypothetical protein